MKENKYLKNWKEILNQDIKRGEFDHIIGLTMATFIKQDIRRLVTQPEDTNTIEEALIDFFIYLDTLDKGNPILAEIINVIGTDEYETTPFDAYLEIVELIRTFEADIMVKALDWGKYIIMDLIHENQMKKKKE